MAVLILLIMLVCLAIILLACNIYCEDTCPYIRPKYGISIDIDKCQFENFTMEQGTFSCIEKCDRMSEVSEHIVT